MFLGKRADLLASELQRFGMGRPAATTLSSEMLLRHPLAHRVGVPKLARRLVRYGLGSDDATHLALTLWGLERLMLGASFQDVLQVLRRAGVEEALAFPACVEARRLWCEGAAPEDVVDVDLKLARWCGLMLGLLLVAHLALRVYAQG